jgi:putative FmdB family regulatory protein
VPTYQYKCEDCGYTFEEFQKMSDAPLKFCPQCNGKVNRVISGGEGFIFKEFNSCANNSKKATSQSGGCCGLENPCDNPKRCCE